jgi:hypothetical protein
MTHPIIVLGMHRSGTSLTADIVRRWGASAGDQELSAADRWNAKGYWEGAQLVAFDNQLLAAVRSNVYLPPSDRERNALIDMAARGPYRERALRLIGSMDECGAPWFWKDPRLSILLPFWKILWGEVTYVITVRNPYEVAGALYERDCIACSGSMILWERYMTEILRSTEGHPRRIFVSYERLIERPQEQCRRLSHFLNECSYQPRPDIDEQILGGMVQCIDRQLRHHDASFHENLKGIQYRLFRRLDDAAALGTQEVDRGAYAMREGWRGRLIPVFLFHSLFRVKGWLFRRTQLLCRLSLSCFGFLWLRCKKRFHWPELENS